jgi:hypothetical protein
MKILYRPEYNIDLGLLNRLHPFDGCKFEKVFQGIYNDIGMAYDRLIETKRLSCSAREIGQP